MLQPDWLDLFTAALGGGLVVKLIEIVHGEYKGWKLRRTDHSKDVDQSLEPLLKAADELFGKLRSLGEQDFLPIRSRPSDLSDRNFASLVYLFVQFWSEVEIIRFRKMSGSVARSPRAKHAKAFFACLESRRLRLIDRISQRALGEAVLLEGRTANFVEFIRLADSDIYMKRWLEPLIEVLGDVSVAEGRQRVIRFSVVLHALIDTLDPQHLVTKDRPAIPNKLNRRTKRDLAYRVFGIYLPFVGDRVKYLGPQL
jgi:hypothetical protein